MKSIPQGILQEITQRLVAEFQPEQIFLFGSHAWGMPDEDSDIDLMVIVSQSDARPIERAVRARRCLRGIRMPKDILVKTRVEFDKFSGVYASLEAQILRRGKVLYDCRETGIGAELADQSAE